VRFLDPRFLAMPKRGRETQALEITQSFATTSATKEDTLSYADVCAKFNFAMFSPSNDESIRSLVVAGSWELHDRSIPIPRRPALVTKADIMDRSSFVKT
jgi:hypothetical protein